MMDTLTHFIVIRDYKPGDELQCQEIVNEGTMSTVNNAMLSLVELTFELVVLTNAVMFIFLGLPFVACMCSIPVVIFCMYMCVWSGHKLKAFELNQDLGNIPRVYMSSDTSGFWVAEAFEPFCMNQEPSKFKYQIMTENDIKQRNIDTGILRRALVGTVGIVRSDSSGDCAWLRRMSVKRKYQCKGIAKALLREAIHFCSLKDYQGIELVTSEWHDSARDLYIKNGFQLKQMYHKQLLGSIVTVLVYQLYLKIQSNKLSISP